MENLYMDLNMRWLYFLYRRYNTNAAIDEMPRTAYAAEWIKPTARYTKNSTSTMRNDTALTMIS